MKNSLTGGIRYVLKEYHEVMATILEAREQTQAEAAMALGISLSYFQQLYRLKRYPNFFTQKGKELEERIRDWSGIAASLVFPEGFYTRQFLDRPKTHTVTVPWNRFLRMNGHSALPLPPIYALPSPTPPKAAVRKRKRRAKKK